jgi:peroxiredoxin Q/BCP
MQIGSMAPDFQLPLHTGEEFRLSSNRGKASVVLYFCTKDFPGNWTKDDRLVSKTLKEIERLGARIIGISADSNDNHRMLAREFDFSFPLASDPRMEVFRNYRTLWLRGLAIRRITYIVDKQGIIRGKSQNELLVDRHWNYVLRILRELNDEDSMRRYNRQFWNL